jgi:hypothetical protein
MPMLRAVGPRGPTRLQHTNHGKALHGWTRPDWVTYFDSTCNFWLMFGLSREIWESDNIIFSPSTSLFIIASAHA